LGREERDSVEESSSLAVPQLPHCRESVLQAAICVAAANERKHFVGCTPGKLQDMLDLQARREPANQLDSYHTASDARVALS
jgi:hypothetical protein